MKAIELEIDELPQSGRVDANGEFTFYLFTSNYCDGEFEEAMETLISIWALEAEVSLSVNMKTRSLFTELYEMHCQHDGTVDLDDMKLFNALRNDCQWIIDRVDALKVASEQEDQTPIRKDMDAPGMY